ncbi:protein LIAT1 [Lathamus discolor]|uniref:protein LIAT1 n=1 Tax=Lathamus discolor TaxID=678569 RepID=UPI0032B7F46B
MEGKVLRGGELKGEGSRAAQGSHARPATGQEGSTGRRRGARGCPCPPPPQTPGTKPPQRKKQQRLPCRSAATSTTPVRAAKHHHTTRKQQACSSQLPEIPGPGRNPDPAQNNAEENRKDAEMNKVVVSTASTLDSAQTDQGLSAQLNESLRWDGILEDPVAEEERLCIYKMNRRKRYELYLQQHFPTKPCPTARHSP